MQRFIDTCWVDHSLKKRRTDFTIETVLYRPRLKFVVMPLKKWANILCKFKKGVGKLIRYLWTEYCNATKDMVDRTSVLLRHSLYPIFVDPARSFLRYIRFHFSCPYLARLSIADVHVLFQLSLSDQCEMILMIEDLILTWKIKIINQCCCSLLICFMYLRIMLACVHLAC